MNKKLYWGLGTLAILLIGVSLGTLLIRPTDTTLKKVYIDVDPAKEVVDQMRHQASKDKPPTARPGYKIVQHGDHYREVPIAESKNAIPVPPTPKPAIPGLTYHAELLETNPVKALRLMAEELGHWSKNHIPPFPPDDLEAQNYARTIYLCIYLEEEHPDSKRVGKALLEQLDAINEYPYGARQMDLSRLGWVMTTLPEHKVYRYPGFHPSDYFKSENPYLRKALEELGEKKALELLDKYEKGN